MPSFLVKDRNKILYVLGSTWNSTVNSKLLCDNSIRWYMIYLRPRKLLRIIYL
ncbi:hypothetical protein BCAH1134_C0295 (plasmid) [Bacillus cereus AH1134]|nr:hypothetical protein BCAH1134_C0295 [Bacillus cereus AH1134]